MQVWDPADAAFERQREAQKRLSDASAALKEQAERAIGTPLASPVAAAAAAAAVAEGAVNTLQQEITAGPVGNTASMQVGC